MNQSPSPATQRASASVSLLPWSAQLQQLELQLNEVESALRGVRFAILRSQRLRDRLRSLLQDLRAANPANIYQAQIQAVADTVEATKQLFDMLSRITVFDYFVSPKTWNDDILRLSRNIAVCRREIRLPGQPRDVAEEDVVDGRLDAETFGRFIKNVGGNRSAMKTEAEALATRDAAALLNVFKQIRDSPRGRGMGFEAVFLRNSEQILRSRSGTATPLSPAMGPLPSSPYQPPRGVHPPLARPPMNIPPRRDSVSRPSPLSTSDPTRPIGSASGRPASFFMPNAYRTGPSDLQRPIDRPPASGRLPLFNEPRSFRPSGPLFGPNAGEDDLLREAERFGGGDGSCGSNPPSAPGFQSTPGPQTRRPSVSIAEPGPLPSTPGSRRPSVSQGRLPQPPPPQGSQYVSPQAPNGPQAPSVGRQQPTPGTSPRVPSTPKTPPSPRYAPERRGSGSATVLQWVDPRTHQAMVWRPFDAWRFWDEPGWLTRDETVDHETIAPGDKAMVIAGWRSSYGPLARAIESRRIPKSALERLHVEINTGVVVLGLFTVKREVFVAAYSLKRVGEGNACAYGLLPLSSLSKHASRSPASASATLSTVDTCLHESAMGFHAHVKTAGGLAPVAGTLTALPKPAMDLQRVDEESSPLSGAATVVMTSELARVTEARKRLETREMRDNFGAVQRQTAFIFEMRVRGDFGSEVRELLFFSEAEADDVALGARRLYPPLPLGQG